MGSRIALRAGVNDAVYLKRMLFTIEPVDRPRPVAGQLKQGYHSPRLHGVK